MHARTNAHKRTSDRKTNETQPQIEPESKQNRIQNTPELSPKRAGRPPGAPGAFRDVPEGVPEAPRSSPRRSRESPERLTDAPRGVLGTLGRSADASDSVRSSFFATIARRHLFASIAVRFCAILVPCAGCPTCVSTMPAQSKRMSAHFRRNAPWTARATEHRPKIYPETSQIGRECLSDLTRASGKTQWERRGPAAAQPQRNAAVGAQRTSKTQSSEERARSRHARRPL